MQGNRRTRFVLIVGLVLLLFSTGCFLIPPEQKITVDIAEIQGVSIPVVGDSPSTVITETDQFTGIISWSPDDAVTNGCFFTSTIYTATITLTPKSGYTFDNVPQNFFTVGGATTVTNDADSGVITAVFPQTESPE